MNTKDMELKLRNRIQYLREIAPDSIGDMLRFELVNCDEEKGEYVLHCTTLPWMRNIAGTLHGGMCATVVDQAMGFVSYCLKDGTGIVPTIQLEVNYHRPLIPGEDVVIHIHVISETKSLISLAASASLVSAPEQVCISSTAIYFYKPAE